MIEIEQAADALASNDPAIRVGGLPRFDDEAVVDTLVVPLAMVVLDELEDDAAKMSLVHRHDSIEALSPHGKDESFSERVQIRAPWGESDDLHSGAFEGSSELCRVERIPIEYQ